MEKQINTPPLEKIFISYSRTDSDFVLKLAKDLRDAGANIWIDQLDIPAGAHWDKEIEKALNSSSSVIAVLSTSSINSKNFMDEVSYTLEQDKRVIPVMIDNCQIPFRLRRLQRVDFTSDYENAYGKLLSCLNVQPNPQTPRKQKPNIHAKKYIVGAFGFAILILAGWLIIKNDASRRDNNEEITATADPKLDSLTKDSIQLQTGKDDHAWEAAHLANTMSAFLEYLKNYPNGRHAKEAVDSLESLNSTKVLPAPNQKAADDRAWKQAERLNTITAFQNYMRSYSNGLHVQEAQKKITLLENQQREDEQNRKDEIAWQTTVKENTVKAYLEYQANFPKGKHFNEAGRKIPEPEPKITASEVLNKISVHVRKDRTDRSGNQIAYNHYLSGEAKYLDVIREVRYVRNHGTFAEKANNTYVSSTNRNTKFNFKGYQWGQVSTIYITLILSDGTESKETLMDLVYDN